MKKHSGLNRERVEAMLICCEGSITETAYLLNTTRSTLYNIHPYLSKFREAYLKGKLISHTIEKKTKQLREATAKASSKPGVYSVIFDAWVRLNDHGFMSKIPPPLTGTITPQPTEHTGLFYPENMQL